MIGKNIKQKLKYAGVTIKAFSTAMDNYVNEYEKNKENYNGFKGYVNLEGNYLFVMNKKKEEVSILFCYTTKDYKLVITDIDID